MYVCRREKVLREHLTTQKADQREDKRETRKSCSQYEYLVTVSQVQKQNALPPAANHTVEYTEES